MAASVRVTVHVTHPLEPTRSVENGAWLTAAAARHHGELDRYVMESYPAQQFARFPTVADATAFVTELADTGRWRAQLSTTR